MQQSLFDDGYDNTPVVLDLPDADLVYYPNFISPERAQELDVILQQHIAWRKEQITVYGKTYDVPRLQAWYGDTDAAYEYSGLAMQPKPWTTELLELKHSCELITHTKFNSVLANLYRDGADGVGRHADDEEELGPRPTIASLSFGETRNLDFYHNHSQQKLRLALESGSLLVMKGSTQQHWQHCVAKTKKPVGTRINLTYRFIKGNVSF